MVLKTFPQTPYHSLMGPWGSPDPSLKNASFKSTVTHCGEKPTPFCAHFPSVCAYHHWNGWCPCSSAMILHELMISLMKLMSNSFHAHIAQSSAAAHRRFSGQMNASRLRLMLCLELWMFADVDVSVSCSSWFVRLWHASSSDGENRSTNSWSRATLRGDWRCGASQKHRPYSRCPPPQVHRSLQHSRLLG